jgi:hypothetical protein
MRRRSGPRKAAVSGRGPQGRRGRRRTPASSRDRPWPSRWRRSSTCRRRTWPRTGRRAGTPSGAGDAGRCSHSRRHRRIDLPPGGRLVVDDVVRAAGLPVLRPRRWSRELCVPLDRRSGQWRDRWRRCPQTGRPGPRCCRTDHRCRENSAIASGKSGRSYAKLAAGPTVPSRDESGRGPPRVGPRKR